MFLLLSHNCLRYTTKELHKHQLRVYGLAFWCAHARAILTIDVFLFLYSYLTCVYCNVFTKYMYVCAPFWFLLP